MKKITILFLALLMTGCMGKKAEIEYFCNGLMEALDCYYEDDEYIYCTATMPAYITYNNEQISFIDAIAQKIITLEDVEKSGCQHYKLEKENK